MTGEQRSRPPAADRWTDGMRTEPARFEVRTEWLYSEPDNRVPLPEGRKRHAYYRGGNVVARDIPLPAWRADELMANLAASIGAFGDDKDLIVEVRLKDSPTPDDRARRALLDAADEIDRIVAIGETPNGQVSERERAEFWAFMESAKAEWLRTYAERYNPKEA